MNKGAEKGCEATSATRQSICAHYSSLSGRPDIFLGSGTLKKSGPKYGPKKKQRSKK